MFNAEHGAGLHVETILTAPADRFSSSLHGCKARPSSPGIPTTRDAPTHDYRPEMLVRCAGSGFARNPTGRSVFGNNLASPRNLSLLSLLKFSA